MGATRSPELLITRASRRPQATATGYVLTARGRRVLEDARAKERRLNPARGQRRNIGELKRRDGCAYQRRMSSVIVAARGDHRHRAIVLDATSILVDALVELRGSTQGERPEKCRGDANCNKCAPMIS